MSTKRRSQTTGERTNDAGAEKARYEFTAEMFPGTNPVAGSVTEGGAVNTAGDGAGRGSEKQAAKRGGRFRT